jgi:D-lactate dehydrogenase
VKRLRRADNGRVANAAWRTAAHHWSTVTRSGAKALTTASAMPPRVPSRATTIGRAVAGHDQLPAWTPDLPRGGRSRRREASPEGGEPCDALYLPSCVNAMFGPGGDGPGVQSSLEQLCARVGIRLAVPSEIDSLCCGTPWSSKGLPAGEQAMHDLVTGVVGAARTTGTLVVISDASSCTEGFLGMFRDSGLDVQVTDAVQFVADRILPLLPEGDRLDSLALHPTCSSTQLGANDALSRIGEAVAREVHVPVSWGCCGFAGDRGMLHPELTASATAAEAAEVRSLGATAHASCNRTCEIGMSRATGNDYRHLLELLEEVTRGRAG